MLAFEQDHEVLNAPATAASERLTSARAVLNLISASSPEVLSRCAVPLDTALSLLIKGLSAFERLEIEDRLKALKLQSINSAPETLVNNTKSDLAVKTQNTLKKQETMNIARFGSMYELAKISILPDLSPDLTGIIISRGSSDILNLVSGNKSAQFARSSFVTMVELAPSDRRLKDNLTHRADLPELLALRLLPFLNHSQKINLFVAAADINSTMATTSLVEERQSYSGNGVDPSKPIDDTIIRLCADARIYEIADLLASSLKLPHAAIANFLCGRLDHVCGLVLNAARASPISIPAALDLRQNLDCRYSKDRRSAYDAFNSYTAQAAHAIIQDCSDRLIETGLVEN